MPDDRFVAPIRQPIVRETGIGASTTLETPRAPTVFRDAGRTITDEPRQNIEAIDTTALNERIKQTATQGYIVWWNELVKQNGAQATAVSPALPVTFYGTGDPSLVLADVFRNLPFGNQSSPMQTGQALVPVTSSSSGSGNIFLILIVLGLAGFGVYYWYKHRKAQ